MFRRSITSLPCSLTFALGRSKSISKKSCRWRRAGREEEENFGSASGVPGLDGKHLTVHALDAGLRRILIGSLSNKPVDFVGMASSNDRGDAQDHAETCRVVAIGCGSSHTLALLSKQSASHLFLLRTLALALSNKRARKPEAQLGRSLLSLIGDMSCRIRSLHVKASPSLSAEQDFSPETCEITRKENRK